LKIEPMNENKTAQIKSIVAKIDIGKIAVYLQGHSSSKTLKQIIKHSKRALESNDDKKVFKLGTDLAYELDILVNKTEYVKNEEEKKFWLEISRELFENTVGVRDKK
jgi:GTP-binding protein EngB required for normal cell division